MLCGPEYFDCHQLAHPLLYFRALITASTRPYELSTSFVAPLRPLSPTWSALSPRFCGFHTRLLSPATYTTHKKKMPTVPGISATPYEDNLRYFNVVITGPEQSPYESEFSVLFVFLLQTGVVLN